MSAIVIEVTAEREARYICIYELERRSHADADECEFTAGAEQKASFDRCRPRCAKIRARPVSRADLMAMRPTTQPKSNNG